MSNKITIDEKACLKHKLTLEEFLIAFMYRQANSLADTTANLLNREVLVCKDHRFLVTQHWSEVIDEILCDSAGGCERSDEDLQKLAIAVKDCFPQQKMKDRFGRETPYYYRCNRSEVAKALKRFFTQYGNEYSDEEIIDATKRYVASFRGNYTGMRIAKYFIMKNPVKQGEDGNGYVEQVSDLLTFLENKESEGDGVVINDDDWLLSSRN